MLSRQVGMNEAEARWRNPERGFARDLTIGERT